jgi:hypothetical protein
VVLVEFDVDHVVLLHLGDGMGGDQLGVEALGHVGQVLDDALDVHHHGVAGAGDDGQLLLQVGARLGTPWRWRISLAVQQMPPSWMPLAPLDLA